MGQCGPVITTFPYAEGFETGPAWTSGGTGNDWTWGTPAHPVINSAGGGVKSWCVGGLTGTYYTSNERSYLESPCFDFSSLDVPRISFKIFWEVERQYDGLVLQYSTNGGVSYSNVGAFGEATDCNTQNWYNSSNITNLSSDISPKHGWSGRSGSDQGNCLGGGGSNGWVIASHCLAMAAHAPSVRFRFFFGAGSTCNNFDGIAIDDILIEEAPAVNAAFSGDCMGSTVAFTGTSTPCPSLFAWDFGDPGSSQNTSALADPSHTYAAPGTYTVTLTATDACGASGTHTMDITILGVELTSVDPQCGADNGSIHSTVIGASGPVDHLWSPGGGTGPDLLNVGAGTYVLTVSAINSCSATATATLTSSGTAITLEMVHTDASCSGISDGTATAIPVGGTAPYAFAWFPMEGNESTITGLGQGDQTCTITDAHGCGAQSTVTINEPSPLDLSAGADRTVCAGTALTLEAQASGGTPGYMYLWQPEGPDVAPLDTTAYSVTVTDAHGCTSTPDTVVVAVSATFVPAFSSTPPTGCAPYCISFLPDPADAAFHLWDFGDGSTDTLATPTHCYTEGGMYTVSLTVIDPAGCAGTVSVPDHAVILSAPAAAFIPSVRVTTLEEPTVRFTNTSTDATDFFWTFGQGDTSMKASPSVAFPAIGCYTVVLEAMNDAGCRDVSSTEICVEDRYLLFMPNAFTPNGDGFNDVLLPITSVRDPLDYRLDLFDRWGARVFTSADIRTGWDGGSSMGGVYVWKARITDTLGGEHELIGHVVLLR